MVNFASEMIVYRREARERLGKKGEREREREREKEREKVREGGKT